MPSRMIDRTPGRSGNAVGQIVEVGCPGFDRLAATVEPQDARRSLERAEHDRQASVLAKVRDRLDAAAGQVEVGHRVLVEHAEGVVALGRQVDVTAVERRRRHEEQVLADRSSRSGSRRVLHERDPSPDSRRPPTVTRTLSASDAACLGVITRTGQRGGLHMRETRASGRPRRARRTPRGATTARRADGAPSGAGTDRSSRSRHRSPARSASTATTSSRVSPSPTMSPDLVVSPAAAARARTERLRAYDADGRTARCSRGTVSTLWFSTSGRGVEDRRPASRHRRGNRGSAPRPGSRGSVAGSSSIVAAKAAAPPSSRSSRATAVSTANCKPIRSTASATREGSSSRAAAGAGCRPDRIRRRACNARR